MIRTSIRRVSTKSIPYEPIPKNKYNQVRSAYNFKPAKNDGFVYSPPAAIIKPQMITPYIFLPENDPRRELAKQHRIDPKIVAEMPIIRQINAPQERQYNVDADTINKIKELRAADPERWTLKEISKEFNIEMDKLHFFLRSQFPKKPTEPVKVVSKKLLDRQKRKQLWLRNQY